MNDNEIVSNIADDPHAQRWRLIASAIVDSDPVIATYAACEWDDLHDDGKQWLAAIMREAFRRFSAPTPGMVLVPRELLEAARKESGHGSAQASGAIKRIRKMLDAMLAASPSATGAA